jgi:hypothetical protein
MTYGNSFPDRWGNCRDPAVACLSSSRGKLKSFESPFKCLRAGMDIALRDDDTAVPGDAHDGEGVHAPIPPGLVSIV